MPNVFLSCDQWLFQSCDQILKPAGWTGPKMGLNVKFRLFWVFRITGTKHAERALGRSSRSLLNPPPREEDLPSAQTFKHTPLTYTFYGLLPCFGVISEYPLSTYVLDICDILLLVVLWGFKIVINFLRKSRWRGCRGAEAPSLRSKWQTIYILKVLIRSWS